MSDDGMRQLGEAIATHINAPPLRKNQERAIWGTWLLAAGVYDTHDFIARYDIDIARTGAAFVRDPQATAAVLGGWFIAWCALMLFGCLWIVVGVRNARAPREGMAAFWSIVFAGVMSAALWRGWYLDDIPAVNWYLGGFYIASLAASLMALFVFMRGAGGAARQTVQRHIGQNEVVWRSDRRR